MDFRGLKNLSRKKSCFYGGLKNLFKKTFMCKISLEYKLKTKFSLKQVALQVELGEFRGNFGGVRKMFLKYLSVRCARKDTKPAQVRLASIRENRNFLYQTFLFRFLGFCLDGEPHIAIPSCTKSLS